VEVEDEVEFAHVSEVLVEHFHEGLHEFEDDELVLVLVDDGDEVETGVALVDDLVLLVVQEVAHLGVAGDHQLVHLSGGRGTSFRMRCFSVWLRLDEYHLVRRERPCLLMRKKQWIICALRDY
jgi:hypothetical protein